VILRSAACVSPEKDHYEPFSRGEKTVRAILDQFGWETADMGQYVPYYSL